MNTILLSELENANNYYEIQRMAKDKIKKLNDEKNIYIKKYEELQNIEFKHFAFEGICKFFVILSVIGAIILGCIWEAFNDIWITLPYKLLIFTDSMLFVIGLFSFFMELIFEKNDKKRIQRDAKIYWEKTACPKMALIDGTIGEINIKIEVYAKENAFLLENIPLDYRNEYSVYDLYKIVKNGRADTWKEAVNIFEEDAYRERTFNQYYELSSKLDSIDMGNYLEAQLLESEISLNQIETNDRLRQIEFLEFLNTLD